MITPGAQGVVGPGGGTSPRTRGLSSINAEVTRQAQMVAYVNVFHLMTIISLAAMPLLLILRKAPKPEGDLHLAVE